jgi:hypothetical protein
MCPRENDACPAARSIADHQRSAIVVDVLKAVEKLTPPLYVFSGRSNGLAREAPAVPPFFCFSLLSRSTESSAT